MAHRVALVTDSTCDIPKEWRQQYEIRVVPLTIIFGPEQLLDGIDISPERFYERLPQEKDHCSTSQPAPQAFLTAFNEIAESGAEEIMVVTISSAMSGTIESARQAAKMAKIPVHVVDGKSNSMGIGWQVIAAARAREAGGGLSEMLAAAEQARAHMAYYITLDTIEYLSKGGRIAGAARLLNSIIQIKPLIYVNHETGKVGASMPGRSRKSAVENMVKEFFNHVDASRPLHIMVLHNHVRAEAEALAERVRQQYAPQEVLISIVSPVLGVHTGPGALALCGYSE